MNGVRSRTTRQYSAAMTEVPNELRPAIAEELQALVYGDLPELLTWVRGHGEDGATLVPQPEEIWSHQRTSATEVEGGGWFITLPLWTDDESPSDLLAEVEVTSDGVARIRDVRVP